MRSMRMIIAGLACLSFAVLTAAPAHAAPTREPAEQSQIVAKLNGRDITMSDLRGEMARLGLNLSAEDAERIALENIITRTLLVTAAKSTKLHRRPEALRRMAAASDQALADLYMASVSEPPEPTMAEIEDFVMENPALFRARRIYTFAVLTMETSAFKEDALTPLFDATENFRALSAELKKRNANFATTTMVQASDAFPKSARRQLGEYGVTDNIVLKGDSHTQIMKIIAVADVPVIGDDALASARQMLLQQSARNRADSLLEDLKTKAAVSYFRAQAAPRPQSNEKDGG